MRIGGGAVSIADVTDREARDLGFLRPFWLNEIRNGRAFMGGANLAASVGDNGHIQLHNPGGSGITVIVFSISHAVYADGTITLRVHDTAITTNTGNGQNLLRGGTGPVGDIRTVDNAGSLGTTMGSQAVLANTPFFWTEAWGIELGAGEGVLVTGDSNVRHACTYLWIEV